MVNYKDLGIKTIINAAGTYTKYSGSLMSKEVLKAMTLASQSFVNIEELMEKSGEYIAKLLNVESALITSGAAAGLVLSTAACITNGEEKLIRLLPNTEGMKNEVIILRCHRNPFDNAILATGAKIVEIGNIIEETKISELDDAINENTCAIVFFEQSEEVQASLSLEQVISVAQSRNIPIIVDAAAELPPIENLQKFFNMGSDVVLFSGGKDIRGPQSSGIMVGKKDIIDICRLISYPNNTIGRPMKLDKETIIGLITALEIYLKEDHDLRMQTWKEQVVKISNELSGLSGLKVSQGIPSQPFTQPAIIPRVFIEIDKNILKTTKEDLANKLYQGEPSIVVAIDKKFLIINPHMLNKGEEDIVIKKMKKIIGELNN